MPVPTPPRRPDYPKVPMTCPRHPTEQMEWYGRVLRCSHADYGHIRDEYGLGVKEVGRCQVAYSLAFMFADPEAARKLDIGVPWYKMLVEPWTHERYMRPENESDMLEFPAAWGIRPKGYKLKVAGRPPERFYRNDEWVPLRISDREADDQYDTYRDVHHDFAVDPAVIDYELQEDVA